MEVSQNDTRYTIYYPVGAFDVQGPQVTIALTFTENCLLCYEE